MRRHPTRGFLLPAVALVALVPAPLSAAEPVSYNRDVRPLLARHCFACHGPGNARPAGGLRLDVREEAVKRLRSGDRAIVPGDHRASELYRRVVASAEDGRMPPEEKGKALGDAEVEVLRRWIDEGARYEQHWAYVPPQRPPVPAVRDSTWSRNPIDTFVLARLEREGLHRSPEADRATLARRLHLDLLGLPPAPEEVRAFVEDRSPDAYAKLVERLLASPHRGERIASVWLDLARFADTNGYRLDNHRDMWPWRDWVIAAFNANMPFDRFTVEQLAGDLLPGATREQRVATGFHRNTMVNFGNGSDPREYLFKSASDRVNTTAAVWLGTTMACAQCHDHKYDPFTQKDYYRLYAFFNNTTEKGLDGEKGNPVPVLKLPSPAQEKQLATLRGEIDRLNGCADEAARLRAEKLARAEARLLTRIPETLVMEERPGPATARVALRGDYLSEGEAVTPGVPTNLLPWPKGAPANRLGLARWLVDPANPLTARVAVNRVWQMHFGAGLVRTSDDFGTQGELPSHPELLDWLAAEFVASGWDVKALQRLIVTSATYRQSSRLTPELQERDPQNVLLARAPRLRLEAEHIRDNALTVSGLLHRRVGGPSVRPHQPAGLWEQVAVGGDYTSQTYVPSRGADLYRRGVYTYWKRSLPHPSLVAFDAPTREQCSTARPRTNTPLQSLVLLNDPGFVEAARALAHRVLAEGGADEAARLRHAFRLCTARDPDAHELGLLRLFHAEQQAHYRQHSAQAKALSSGEEAPAQDVRELAAWTAVANLLLNLDETITRE